MIKREARQKLIELSEYFKIVSVIGPRQSGKTTLVKDVFQDKPYVSLENPDTRRFALDDPRGFLENYKDGAIFDEVQRVPELFSYLQEIVDNKPDKGIYILTGSNNFLLQESISQSLAGRVGFLTLLPFSTQEININSFSDDELILTGLYPPVHDQNIPVELWTKNYIRTYIERDVRQIKNITDLIVFERFLSLLAGRCGTELNYTSLSNEVGVDVKTIQSWISILASSYIIYLLKPHYKNFNKTITKRPKIYFIDTSIVCSLLRIVNINQLSTHPLRGSIFENFIIIEFLKKRYNDLKSDNLYYYRDKAQHEIDLIIDHSDHAIPLEIKSAMTINSDFFKNINYWLKLSNEHKGYLIYAGNELQKRSHNIEVIPWRNLDLINI